MSYEQQAAPPPPPQYGTGKPSNGLAVAGFVLALLGALCSFIPIVNIFGDVLAFIGLIFGVIGLIKSGSLHVGRGLSIAAIILALAAFVISVVINLVLVKAVDSAVKGIGVADNTPAPVAGKIGQAVEDGDFTFVVNSMNCGVKTAEGLGLATPKGDFCAVDVTVTNNGKEAQTFAAFQVQGFIASKQYDADPLASITANADVNTFVSSIKPGNSVTAKVLFDVPVGTKLDTVELHDSLLSGGTSVSVE